MKVMETWLETHSILYPVQCHYSPVNLPSQLKCCSHDLWPRNWTAGGRRLSALGFSLLKLNVQTTQEPHLGGRSRRSEETWRRDGHKHDITISNTHTHTRTQTPSHQCFWSHDHGRGANSAWLFTLLISGVVTSRGAHRLTSAHTCKKSHPRQIQKSSKKWCK